MSSALLLLGDDPHARHKDSHGKVGQGTGLGCVSHQHQGGCVAGRVCTVCWSTVCTRCTSGCLANPELYIPLQTHVHTHTHTHTLTHSQGLCLILENRLSHPLMGDLLPLLQPLLHDSSEKVRIAFLELLLLVKGMRMIKFWQICPLEHLLGENLFIG